jgi:uncharacterized membrane protein YgaE (UPF0421/DUF939 family)
MKSHSSVNSDGFVNKALDAMPKFVWAFLGVMVGLVILLMFSGLDGAFTRVVNAYATRIERSVDQLEGLASKFSALEAKVISADSRITVVEKRLDEIERENRKYHRSEK